jgi:transglutaminase-like putative cysteine protease
MTLRIRISHETTYSYEQPVRSLMQALRVMPRDHEGQVVVSWRIEASIDGRLRSTEDTHGNLVHMFQAEGPFDTVTMRVDGIVETTDTTGFVRGTKDRLPPQVYLRQTQITQPDEGLILYARKTARAGQTHLEQLHALLDGLHGEMAFITDAQDNPVRAAEAFALRKGTAIDLAHIFCASARELGVPARLVEGFDASRTRNGETAARHAWAEAHVEGYGWIGFDPALGRCPADSHVRISVGLDHADAAPVRLARVGGGHEKANVALAVMAIDQ